MKKLNLIVTDAEQTWHARLPEAWVHAVVASLSADPRRLVELHAATERFLHPRHRQQLFGSAIAGDSPDSLGFADGKTADCAIDLAGQLLYAKWDQAENPVRVLYQDINGSDSHWLKYDITSSWRLVATQQAWCAEVAPRRQVAEKNNPPRDLRAIVYGPALLQHVVDGVQAGARQLNLASWRRDLQRRDAPCDAELILRCRLEQRLAEATPKRIEATICQSWLETRLAELGDQRVMDVLTADALHLDRDLRHRARQWAQLGWCPPALGEDATAFVRAGFGPNELAIYGKMIHDLARTYLCHYIREGHTPESLDMNAEVNWLARILDFRYQLRETLSPPLTARQIIVMEQHRIPLMQPAQKAPSECVCPVCRILGDLDEFLPTFCQIESADDMNCPCHASIHPHQDNEVDDDRLRTNAAELLHVVYDEATGLSVSPFGTTPQRFDPASSDPNNQRRANAWRYALTDPTGNADDDGDNKCDCTDGCCADDSEAEHDGGDFELLRELKSLDELLDELDELDVDGSLSPEDDSPQDLLDAMLRREDAFARANRDEMPATKRIWQRVQMSGEVGEEAPEVDLFTMACCAGELLDDLLRLSAERQLLELFNRRIDEFGLAYRRPAAASLPHAVNRLGALLDQVEATFPTLRPKVQDLQTRLVKMQQLIERLDGLP